jgi:hypothetical protein
MREQCIPEGDDGYMGLINMESVKVKNTWFTL